jgi:hypothetical protein
LTVSHGLLGEIVIDDQSMLSVVTEPFSHGATSEGSKVLQRSGFRGRSSNNDGILQSIVLLESLDKLSNSRSLLADSDVDTVKLLGFIGSSVPSLLVEDGIECDGSLSGLTITNDQFTLTTSNWHHCVDALEASLDGLVDRTTGKNTGSLELSTTPLLGLERALAVNWVSKGIDDTPKKFGANWNIDLVSLATVCRSKLDAYNFSSSLDSLTFLDKTIGTEKHNTDLASFQVHAHTLDTRCKPNIYQFQCSTMFIFA